MKGLADEFDLADTAGAELDVGVHALVVQLFGDHLLHIPQGFDGAEVQVTPVDEGPQHRLQGGAVPRLAGEYPRLDHGIALPLPGLGLVVVLHGPDAHGQGARVAEGPQSGVHAKDEAVGGLGVEGLDQALGQAHEELLVLQWAGAADHLTLGREGEDEVDVGRQVQLPRPELAHPDDQQALFPALGIPRYAEFRPGPSLQSLQGHADAAIGQLRQVFQGLVEPGQTAEVAPDDAGHLPAAGEPQGALQAGFVFDAGQ